ncbi:hypothetical protein llap_11006 [Limosa lapponica baueri]|uniref:Uncharacterized protein n=1 Tax=Limosa lapponica baueri TaxID=1758121 RepID=A0A2I0TYB8_LIMLA|nr:hypothetical protein llap_11006 [Limosa lapponica baueri]
MLYNGSFVDQGYPDLALDNTPEVNRVVVHSHHQTICTQAVGLVYPIFIRVAAYASSVCPRFPAAWSEDQPESQALFNLEHWAEKGHGLAGSLQLLSFIQFHRASIKHEDSDGLHSQLLQMVHRGTEAMTGTKLVQEPAKPALE